ncbi:MAG: hypothetical protein SFX73_14435 [Kofleriaceae bacterium]|nr:hypothetical protein [Kofleriaceae bacterium]
MSARLWLTAAALATTLARTAVAQPKESAPPPPPSVSCEFLEISATSAKDAAIDPELEKLRKKFKKPPFSSWNSFKLLMKTTQQLTQRKTETIQLKQGKATATLHGIVNTSNVRLAISLEDDKGKNIVNTTATFAGGDYLVYGHSLPDNAGHMLALTCK